MPYDVYGNLMTENGKPISAEKYLGYLSTVLPGYYLQTNEFAKYREALLGHEAPKPGQYGW